MQRSAKPPGSAMSTISFLEFSNSYARFLASCTSILTVTTETVLKRRSTALIASSHVHSTSSESTSQGRVMLRIMDEGKALDTRSMCRCEMASQMKLSRAYSSLSSSGFWTGTSPLLLFSNVARIRLQEISWVASISRWKDMRVVLNIFESRGYLLSSWVAVVTLSRTSVEHGRSRLPVHSISRIQSTEIYLGTPTSNGSAQDINWRC